MSKAFRDRVIFEDGKQIRLRLRICGYRIRLDTNRLFCGWDDQNRRIETSDETEAKVYKRLQDAQRDMALIASGYHEIEDIWQVYKREEV